jgi:autotransporter-associated beta strand protein
MIPVAMIVAAAALVPGATRAQTLTWGATGGGGTGPWDTLTANWFDGSGPVLWTQGSSATFGGTAGTVSVAATPITVQNMTFLTDGYIVTANPLTLSGSTPTITLGAGVSATISSDMAGSAGLVKSGAGSLIVTGSLSSLTGAVTASGGSLTMGSPGAMSYSGPTIVSNGATLTFAAAPAVNSTIGSTAFFVNGPSSLVLDSSLRENIRGTITFDTVGGGVVDFTGTNAPSNNGGSVLTGNLAIVSSGGAQDRVISSSGAGLNLNNFFRLTLNTTTSDSSLLVSSRVWNVGSLTKTGPGTAILTFPNTYTGVTTISGGILSTPLLADGGAASGIGNSSNAANNLVLDGGSLQYTGTGASTDRLFTLTTNGGSIDASGSGPLTFSNTTAAALSGAGARNFALTGSNTGANTFSPVLGDNVGPTSLIKLGAGTWVLTAANTYSGGTAINGGTLQVSADNNLGAATGSLSFDGGTLATTSTLTSSRTTTLNAGGGTFDVAPASTFTMNGAIGGTGALIKAGTGTLVFAGSNAYSGGTTIASGTLQAGATNAFSAASAFTVAGGATLDLNNLNQTIGSLAGAGNVTLGAATLTTGSDNNSTTFSGGIFGSGGLIKTGTGTFTLSGANTYSGTTTIDAGTLQAGATNAFSAASEFTIASGATLNLAGFDQTIGSLEGTGNVTLGSAELTVGDDNANTTFSGTIAGNGGSLIKAGSGVLTLTGINSYTGPTSVNAGALFVDGSIASSNLTTVSSGATLGGSGSLGSTIVLSGGTFAPGPSTGTPGTLAVAGNLAFQSGAIYLVQVNPSASTTTNVSGTATLAGTVQANFEPGAFVHRSYTILTAAGGRNGTFDALVGVPPDFQTSLSYTGTTAVLNLKAELVPPTRGPTPTPPPGSTPGPPPPPPPSFTKDQFNVGTAIDNSFNNGGALPPTFLPLFNLTGSNLTNALSQLSGEAPTGAQTAAFQLGNQFLNLMLDPFVDGRNGIGTTDHPPLGFAPQRGAMPPELALAYASVFKAPPAAAYEPRWTVWGGAYGAGNHTTGDPAVIGSHDLSARTAGFAGGFDYHFTPDTVAGFALAGGGTSWGLSQGLGGGRSDALQAGLYGATRWGPAYLAAAFAFTNHWMSTDRFDFGDHLTADFDAQSYGGRLEGGYRFTMAFGGVTPYAALQAQSFHTPAYAETDAIPDGFALAFPAREATDTRSELGARFDRAFGLSPNAVLALRGRIAWAHDWVSDPSLMPLFQSLPGSSFIVNGATPAKDSALASAGAELRLANGITLLAKFDGDFASHSSTYAGTGTIRYSW